MKKNVLILVALLMLGVFISENSQASIVIPSNSSVILPGKPDPATLKSAIREFKNLSKNERKDRIKEVKALIKHYKAEKKAGHDASDNTVLLCYPCNTTSAFSCLPV